MVRSRRRQHECVEQKVWRWMGKVSSHRTSLTAGWEHRDRSGPSNVQAEMPWMDRKIPWKGTSKGNFLPRSRQGRPWFAQGMGLQGSQAGKEVRTIPSCCIQDPQPGAYCWLPLQVGTHTAQEGGGKELKSPNPLKKLLPSPWGTASTQFKDESLPASLKPEPFPPRHVPLALCPLFLLLLPPLLPSPSLSALLWGWSVPGWVAGLPSCCNPAAAAPELPRDDRLDLFRWWMRSIFFLFLNFLKFTKQDLT